MRATWIQVILIVLGAAGLGALLVTGSDWWKPNRQTTMRGLAGAVLAAILAVAFATGEKGTPVSFVTGDDGGTFVQDGEQTAGQNGAVAPGGITGTAGGRGGAGGAPGTPGVTAAGPIASVDPNLPTLKIGYIGLDPQSATGVISAFVPNYPIPEDPEFYAQTVEEWVNTHGGVNGHKIDLITKTRDPQSSNPNQLLDICKELTEGDKVYAVAGTDSDTDADLCYAEHGVPFICDCGFETTSLKRNAPWLWAPGSVDSESVQITMVTSLGEQGYFAKGTKVGILVRDAPEQWDLYNKKLLPIIKRFNNYAEDDIDAYPIRDTESTADYGEYTSDIQAAVTRFKLAGVDRVFFLYGGDLIALYFMDQAESQRYYPRYGLESSAHTYLTLQANVPQSQLHDSIGVGYQMIVDVDEANGDPYPATGETECFAAFKAKGSPPSDRVQAVYPQQLCDPVFMFKEAARGLGPNFTASAWTRAADQLGTRFQAGVGLPGATRFIPGRYVGIGRYRVLKYVDSCPGDPDANPGGGCYKYASKNLDMPI